MLLFDRKGRISRLLDVPVTQMLKLYNISITNGLSPRSIGMALLQRACRLRSAPFPSAEAI